MIKGYIIDLDGTLLDSMFIWNDIGSRYLLSKNIIPKNDLDKILAPLSINQAIKYISKEYSLNESYQQIYQEINTLLKKRYLTETTLKPGAKDFLIKCVKEQKKLCLLTANTLEITNTILDKYSLSKLFTKIITSEQTDLDKQNGEIYQFAAKQLKLKINECVVIEDAFHAIISAKQAGFTVWAIYDTSNQDKWAQICTISDKYFKNISEMGD